MQDLTFSLVGRFPGGLHGSTRQRRWLFQIAHIWTMHADPLAGSVTATNRNGQQRQVDTDRKTGGSELAHEVVIAAALPRRWIYGRSEPRSATNCELRDGRCSQ